MSSVTHGGQSGQEAPQPPKRRTRRYSREFYSQIGKRGARAMVAKYGREHMRAIGSKGGRTTHSLYSPEEMGARIQAGHDRRAARLEAEEASRKEGAA